MGNEEYGDCLDALLKARGKAFTVRRLTTALGYQDPSTVYRWLRNEKPPALNSGVHKKIVEYLGLTPTEEQRLRNAQIYTLARPAKGREESTGEESTSANTSNLAETLVVNWGARKRPRIRLADPSAHSAPILTEMIRLLESARTADGLSDEERTITLTWQSSNPIEMSPKLQDAWQAALQHAMLNGWRIVYLCRLNDDVNRTARLVELMRGLIGMGEYLPRYFTSYGVLTPPYDLLIVPGHGAVTLFACQNPNAVDDGCVTNDEHIIRALQGHARQLASQTTPLMTRYLGSDAPQVERLLRDAEAHSTERVAVKDGLSVTTQPEAWFTASRGLHFTNQAESVDLAAARARFERIAAFRRLARLHDCYDICSWRAIEKLVDDRRYPRDDFLLHGEQSVAMVREHLANVVSLLAMPESHYHLALVDDQQVNGLGSTGIPMDLKWTVMDSRSVFIGMPLPAASGGTLDASVYITEPTVAQGFSAYFHQLWNRIPPPNRDTGNVIARLNVQIAHLDALLAASPD